MGLPHQLDPLDPCRVLFSIPLDQPRQAADGGCTGWYSCVWVGPPSAARISDLEACLPHFINIYISRLKIILKKPKIEIKIRK